jgi:LacI family transcriptional regulator
VHPPLTTLRVNIAELGGRALSALLDAGGEAAKEDNSFVPKLIVRASSGAGSVGGRGERGDSS